MSIIARNFIGSGNRLVDQYLSHEAKGWALEFELSDSYKQVIVIMEELNSILPPGEKFKPGIKTEKYSDKFRIYTGYNNLAVAPEEKRNARNTAFLPEAEISSAHVKISSILSGESLTFSWSYWVPTEKFEINIFNPYLQSEKAKT
jgi:hypothetical protein